MSDLLVESTGEETARQLAEAGIQQAIANANTAWIAAAETAIEATARDLPLFTATDVWDRIPPSFTTHENRAMGAMMRQAARSGIIKATPDWKTTGRAVSHNRPMRIWRSTIHHSQEAYDD